MPSCLVRPSSPVLMAATSFGLPMPSYRARPVRGATDDEAAFLAGQLASGASTFNAASFLLNTDEGRRALSLAMAQSTSTEPERSHRSNSIR